jgi:periplasmic protein TonB
MKHTAMTNNEILRASLLDIIFENRNKSYGAYTLRRDYNQRLLTALGAASFLILLFILINALGKKERLAITNTDQNGSIAVTQVDFSREPEKPKEMPGPKRVPKAATIQYTNVIKIEPEVKTTIPDVSEMDGKTISTQTSDGPTGDGKTNADDKSASGSGLENNTVPAQPGSAFVIKERAPEFPGGPEALKRFMAKNITTPDELEVGEKKMVQIQFIVDKEGNVFVQEIVSSGGNEFDKEVIRVCKKMPRWKPAIQNGVNVSVSYVLPVTFIGVEQ